MHKCHFCGKEFPCINQGENCSGEDFQICGPCFTEDFEDRILEGFLQIGTNGARREFDNREGSNGRFISKTQD